MTWTVYFRECTAKRYDYYPVETYMALESAQAIAGELEKVSRRKAGKFIVEHSQVVPSDRRGYAPIRKPV